MQPHIYIGALSEFAKRPLRRCRIAVYLPTAHALAAVGAILNKAAHIFRRITDKQSYLVRKALMSAQSHRKLGYAALGRRSRITELVEQIARTLRIKIAAQRRRAVYVDNSLSSEVALRKHSQMLSAEHAIPLAHVLIEHGCALVFAGNDISGLKPRECRGAMPENHLLRHTVTSFHNLFYFCYVILFTSIMHFYYIS